MDKHIGYRVLSLGLKVGLGIALCVGAAKAQDVPQGLSESDIYCSGLVTNQAVPTDTYIISGENSAYKNTFIPGDYVYINRGGSQGVKVGDLFQVMRPVHEAAKSHWFKWQSQLYRAMGTTYADIGELQVVHVQDKTATAELKMSCDLMQRGDIVRPFVTRPIPTFHDTKLDIFAAPSGKKTGMVVTTKNFGVVSGAGRIVYVNLGSVQGVKEGDYFRMFRYQGSHSTTLYQPRATAYKAYGFGSTPIAYQWDQLPRQILGEGIVLRTSPNSSTVLLTTVRDAVFVGDYVELE